MTIKTKHDAVQLVLCTYSTVNHCKSFKDKENETCANKVEGQNSALKGLC